MIAPDEMGRHSSGVRLSIPKAEFAETSAVESGFQFNMRHDLPVSGGAGSRARKNLLEIPDIKCR